MRLIYVFAIFLVCASAAALTFLYYPHTESPVASALRPCFKANQSDAARIPCIETAVTSLFAQGFVAHDIVRYASSADAPEAIQNDCHPIGHIAGAAAYRSTHSIEQALAQCTSDCRAACTHGVIGAGVLAELGKSYDEEDIAHADLATLKPLAKSLCDTPNRSVCHAVGHLFYLATENTQEALALCDLSATGRAQESCFNGVLMEGVGTPSFALNPAHPVATATLAVTDHTAPCMGFAPQYRHACFSYLMAFQAPVFEATDVTSTAEKVKIMEGACSALDTRDRAYCFEALGNAGVTFGFGNTDAKRASGFCEQFAQSVDRDACTLGVVEEFVFGGHGVTAYCSTITEQGRAELCFDAMFELSSQPFSTRASMCSDDESCSAHYDSYAAKRASLPDYNYGLFGAAADQ